MTPGDISRYIEKQKNHFKELEARLSDPAIYADHLESKKVSLEHRKLSSLFKLYDRWTEALQELEDNRSLLEEESDGELSEMIADDIAALEAETLKLEKQVQIALIPPDPNSARNIIVEVRPAAGGDEAALFAGELYRVYTRFAETQKWKVEILDYTVSDLGGIKGAMFSLAGDDVYSKMKYESGVHRVQRVPVTESGGRIHTSTVTVSVMGEAEEVEMDINPEDLRIDVFRASGPGGQCVNTTDSAVRITHIPTGVCVVSQQEKSQHRNKDLAMRVLRARLLEHAQQQEMAKQAAEKRSQVGTGDRSERIRTYNFPQNRVTDHRFGVSMYNLPLLMEGDFEPLLEEITAVDSERQFESLLENQ
ncbi:MAG: peptide chain release factor 1 [Victivallales bacterium]|nr:peptide chain release factor 1 [Victivallales bacterium]